MGVPTNGGVTFLPNGLPGACDGLAAPAAAAVEVKGTDAKVRLASRTNSSRCAASCNTALLMPILRRPKYTEAAASAPGAEVAAVVVRDRLPSYATGCMFKCVITGMRSCKLGPMHNAPRCAGQAPTKGCQGLFASLPLHRQQRCRGCGIGRRRHCSWVRVRLCVGAPLSDNGFAEWPRETECEFTRGSGRRMH
jgi:hypothetical protein